LIDEPKEEFSDVFFEAPHSIFFPDLSELVVRNAFFGSEVVLIEFQSTCYFARNYKYKDYVLK